MSAARDRAKLVLGVDDDASIREILGLALRSEGYSFVGMGVGSGEGCLKLLRQTRPNLVLLDVLLPGIDGYETCRRLRDQYPDLDVPIIFLTNRHTMADVKRAIAVGGNDFISKPFRPDHLIGRLKAILDKTG